ncbi:MAG: hypothetical protein U9P36_15575 [Thermodesulfobacteriota bacterium]|nr:hypothetical protein [Thermodesulfobacteriota bacterium]
MKKKDDNTTARIPDNPLPEKVCNKEEVLFNRKNQQYPGSNSFDINTWDSCNKPILLGAACQTVSGSML